MTELRTLLRLAAELEELGLGHAAGNAREAARRLDPDTITSHTGPPGAVVSFRTTEPIPPERRRDVMAEALARRDRHRPDRIPVGVCGSCSGPVFLATGAGVASCPCSAVQIPRRFMRPHGDHEEEHGHGPQTFPGADWYELAQLTASPTATTLPMTSEEIGRARIREGRPFGFARALEEHEQDS